MSDLAPTPTDDDSPIGPIALSLSGGGFRAAGFHLGVLTALQRVGLLDNVRVLSTASGGSLLGARWLLGKVRGESFVDTHFKLSTYLQNADPLRAAALRAARERLTLTQALAEEFEEQLFDDSRFASACMGELFESRTTIHEGSFNASVGASGQPFRFTFSRSKAARIGNQETFLPRKSAQHLRLADVVAASAAFPGAFEPMVMPNDFTWPDLELASTAIDEFSTSPSGLVDGGVYDNQGISSMMLAAKRLAPGDEIDLFFVSDAHRKLEAPQARNARRKSKWTPALRIWHLSALSWLAMLGAGASIYLTWLKVEAERDIDDFRWPTDAIAFGVPIAIAALLIIAILYVRRVLSKTMRPVKEHVGKRAWRAFKRTRVRDAIEGVQTRAKTLENVAAYAFPARVRSLVYRSVWANPEYKRRRAACHIYALTEDSFKHVEGLFSPSELLVKAVHRAATLPTGLALENPKELDDLQVAGQATAIAELLEFLESKYDRSRSSWPLEALELDGALRADWNNLNATAQPLRPATL